jgi:hypothetical protein
MTVVTGRLMSVIGVSREPTLLTFGEGAIGIRVSWNGVLAHALLWSRSGYPVASAGPVPMVSAAGGVPGSRGDPQGSCRPCTLPPARGHREGAWG